MGTLLGRGRHRFGRIVGILFVQCAFSAPAFLGVLLPSVSEAAKPWRITRSWDQAEEAHFSRFIARMGQAVSDHRCLSVTQCLNNPVANLFLDPADPISTVPRAQEGQPAPTAPRVGLRADCGKLPYVLRAYFAWQRGLPFSSVSALAPQGGSRDIRYSPGGNRPYRRRLFGSIGENAPDGERLVWQVHGSVNTGNYRMNPQWDDPQLFNHFYSPRISRDSITPGTLIYDPNGHVIVVYKVSSQGVVSFFDAHPDNSLSAGTFNARFVNSSLNHGAGFKKWRPYQLVGGRVVGKRNSELTDFSLEQIVGTARAAANQTAWTAWNRASWIPAPRAGEASPQAMDFYHYVRTTLATGPLRLNPVQELSTMLTGLCSDLEYRQLAIETSIQRNIQTLPHPERLPNNIYGANDMTWEEYSTPSRDARLKVFFVEILRSTQEMLQKFDANDPTIVFPARSGETPQETRTRLVRELISTKGSFDLFCSIRFVDSSGAVQALRLGEIQNRLFQLSFDPYHCIELRWGFPLDGSLPPSCTSDATKIRWYNAEQYLRNQTERTYDIPMNSSLAELEDFREDSGRGVRQAPDVDLLRFLRSQLR